MTGYDTEAFDAFEAEGWATNEAERYDALAGHVAGRAVARGAEAVGVDLSNGLEVPVVVKLAVGTRP